MRKSVRSSSETPVSSPIDSLRSSPVHGIKPISENPLPVDIEAIEIDPTNPGSLTESLRYQRRAPSIRDSYDILARIVYPVVVCEHPHKEGHYVHVDGFGRISEAKARGQKKINAIVFPPLTLEQRICLRQTLGSAQEPFDAASIIRDLQELARERNLDLSNPEHIKTLVRDLPAKVQKHEKDLVMLARWHPKAVKALGESYKEEGAAIGLDKIRGMDRILRVLEKKHPKTVAKFGGQRDVSLKLANMYLDKKFSEGTRSQEAIRRVAQTLSAIGEDDPAIADFIAKEKSHSELPKMNGKVGDAGEADLLQACKELTSLLLGIETDSLTSASRRALQRTDAVLDQVLKGEKV